MLKRLLIRQNKNTFIRRFGEIGYIVSQLTRHDRNYNDTGADFLEKISRDPKDIDIIVRELLPLYQDISFEELRTDFI
jgi:hypothetical protein